MKLVLIFLIALAVFAPAYGAQVELLENPGFEDGVLDPWTTDGWMINSSDPHSGNYYAYNEEIPARFIEQSFEPVDVNDIISFTLWQKYSNSALSIIRMYYGATDYDEVIIYITEWGWMQFDMTADLRSSGNLEAIRVYDVMSTPPATAYLDDASIIYEDYIGIEGSSIGNIKATFK